MVPLLLAFGETSPPAWGKRQGQVSDKLKARNIPTCVGKTTQLDNCLTRLKKHPHLRGENSGFTNNDIKVSETSPPAWGKQQDVVLTAILDTTFC